MTEQKIGVSNGRVLGTFEEIVFPAFNDARVTAKIDTGAYSGAIHCVKIQEKNQVWPPLIDLYQALVLYNQGRLFEARRLCSAALEFFQPRNWVV